MLMRRFMFTGCVATALLSSAVVAQDNSAKNPVPFQTNTDQARNDATKHMSEAFVTPQQIASCLALDNQEEVILAKFAQEQTKNEDVTNFARMIVVEHQACLKKLSKLAPEATQEGFLTGRREDQPRAQSDEAKATKLPNANQLGKGEAPQTGNTTTGARSGAIDMMQLQREIAQQCITDSKQYLGKKEGAEFDKCFVGMQIAKHAAMHTKLVVLQRHTSDELQEIVSAGIQTTAEHLKAAESLMAQLDDHAAAKLTKNTK